MKRYIEGNFSEEAEVCLEQTFEKELIEEENKYIFSLLDTTGLDEFSLFRKEWYFGSNAFVLSYDLTSLTSFQQVVSFIEEIENIKENSIKNIPCLLIGNKNDLEEKRQVKYEEANEFAKEHGFLFFETSCKTGENVHTSLSSLMREMILKNVGLFPSEIPKQNFEIQETQVPSSTSPSKTTQKKEREQPKDELDLEIENELNSFKNSQSLPLIENKKKETSLSEMLGIITVDDILRDVLDDDDENKELFQELFGASETIPQNEEQIEFDQDNEENEENKQIEDGEEEMRGGDDEIGDGDDEEMIGDDEDIIGDDEEIIEDGEDIIDDEEEIQDGEDVVEDD